MLQQWPLASAMLIMTARPSGTASAYLSSRRLRRRLLRHHHRCLLHGVLHAVCNAAVASGVGHATTDGPAAWHCKCLPVVSRADTATSCHSAHHHRSHLHGVLHAVYVAAGPLASAMLLTTARPSGTASAHSSSRRPRPRRRLLRHHHRCLLHGVLRAIYIAAVASGFGHATNDGPAVWHCECLLVVSQTATATTCSAALSSIPSPSTAAPLARALASVEERWYFG